MVEHSSLRGKRNIRSNKKYGWWRWSIIHRIIAFVSFHCRSWIDSVNYLGMILVSKCAMDFFPSKSISLKMCAWWMKFYAFSDDLHISQLFLTVKYKVATIKWTCIRLPIVFFKLYTDFLYLDFTAWPEIGSLTVIHLCASSSNSLP